MTTNGTTRVEGHAGQQAVAALMAFGTDTMFTLNGGHIWPLYDAARDQGMQVVDTRHEGAKIARENRELQEVYEYLQTPAGKEFAARAEVMALKPGERLIVLKEAARQAQQRPPDLATRVLDSLDRNARYAQEVFQVWSGIGQNSAQAAPEPPAQPAKQSPDKPAAKSLPAPAP